MCIQISNFCDISDNFVVICTAYQWDLHQYIFSFLFMMRRINISLLTDVLPLNVDMLSFGLKKARWCPYININIYIYDIKLPAGSKT